MNTEQVKNLMTLSTPIRAYWEGGACTFRPIRVNDDKTKMDIAFHWMPPRDNSVRMTDRVPINVNPYGRGHEGFRENPGNNNPVVHMESDFVIPSGYIFTVTTDDPSEKPLPSFALLTLQWNLRRIAATQGVAEG